MKFKIGDKVTTNDSPPRKGIIKNIQYITRGGKSHVLVVTGESRTGAWYYMESLKSANVHVCKLICKCNAREAITF